jgi:hypothetical protein
MSEDSQNYTKQSRAELRREAVVDGVMKGKTERQMADELGVTREMVAKIKANPKVQKRIRERVADSYSLTEGEVVGTLVSHMRADITELFDGEGRFDIPSIRRRRLGHLVKKLKVRRIVEGKDEDAQPVDIIELELHNQQSAAVQLCKVLGIEQAPHDVGEAERLRRAAESLAEKYQLPLAQVLQDMVNEKPELASVLIQ